MRGKLMHVQGTRNRIWRWLFDGNWQCKWWWTKYRVMGSLRHLHHAVQAGDPLNMCWRSVRKRRENGTRTRADSTRLRRCTSSARAPIAVKLHRAIVHVTLDEISAGFSLESICRSMRVEIAKVLIHSSDFWHFFKSRFHICGCTPLFSTWIFAP